jgi:hypothetical protein
VASERFPQAHRLKSPRHGTPKYPKGRGSRPVFHRRLLVKNGITRLSMELVGNTASLGETAWSSEARLWLSPFTGRQRHRWLIFDTSGGSTALAADELFHKSTGPIAVALDISISQEATALPAFPQETSCGKADQCEGLLSLWKLGLQWGHGLAPGGRKRKGCVRLRSSPRKAGMSANARTWSSPVGPQSGTIRPENDGEDDGAKHRKPGSTPESENAQSNENRQLGEKRGRCGNLVDEPLRP